MSRSFNNYYWFFLHYLAANYPNDPSDLDRDESMKIAAFLTGPKSGTCARCRADVIEYIRANPLEQHNASRTAFFKYFVDLHNSVNIRLNKPVMELDTAWQLYGEPHWRETLGQFGFDILRLFRDRKIETFPECMHNVRLHLAGKKLNNIQTVSNVDSQSSV